MSDPSDVALPSAWRQRYRSVRDAEACKKNSDAAAKVKKAAIQINRGPAFIKIGGQFVSRFGGVKTYHIW